MSEFIDRFLDQAIREASPDSLRNRILSDIRSATSGSQLDEAALKELLLRPPESDDAKGRDE